MVFAAVSKCFLQICRFMGAFQWLFCGLMIFAAVSKYFFRNLSIYGRFSVRQFSRFSDLCGGFEEFFLQVCRFVVAFQGGYFAVW